jgi:hypothetical protein
LVLSFIVAVLIGLGFLVIARPAGAAGPCGPPVTSVIACENAQPGDPTSDWQVSGQGDTTIQGFSTSMSVNVGQTAFFKINTPSRAYHIDILRIGYYQGNGARIIAKGLLPTATLPQSQPSSCTTDPAATGLIDCGNWAVSASWTVPSNAVSGLYLAHLERDDTNTGNGSLIPFVVRNDSSHSDVLFQTSDETWQAYNTWPSTTNGNSLYNCFSNCPPGNADAYKGAAKVTYNRPWQSAVNDNGASWFMYAEYPMIRFLERNGYDVSYTSGVDVSQSGYASTIEQHKIFTSTGHDEYWSGQQRANVEAARDAGVNLAFFSGNEVFWKTRFEPSIDGSSTPNRTLVSYKETHYNTPVDPQDPPTWTGTWMDPRFSPPADGGRPQNALTGQLFVVNQGTTDITVPAAYSKLRIWRGTRVATLAAGQSTTLDQGVGDLGYEWDVDADNGYRPAGLMDLSSTTFSNAQDFIDYGGTTQNNSTATHHLTLYRAASGALVFGAGTVQWAWGLDNGAGTGTTDVAMQQAMVNLFADMGNVQPATLMSGLTGASPSADTSAPTSTITSPSQGANLTNGSAVTISGTATDAGGGVVAGVEISTDGGTTWHPATTMSAANTSVTWTYSWVAHGSPSTTIQSRAVDDSGNLERPGSGVTVNSNCPCSIFGSATAPTTVDSGATAATEVGVKFKSDTFGYITGIRFYKASLNTGTHVGNLWTSSGQLLASATFSSESASGWQQVSFAQPVSINKDTTYIASYFAPRGHYSADAGYFYTTPYMGKAPTITNVDSPPLHALRNTGATINGVFATSAASTFPTSSQNASSYWVDPVFTPQTFTTAPGQVGNVNATAGYASATVNWSAPTTGDSATSYKITPYIGSAAQSPTTVPGNPAPTSAVVSGLTNGTTYTFTVIASNPAGIGPESPPSNAVSPSSSALHVDDGDFENGLTGWTTSGASAPTASSTQVHSGNGSALLGTVQPGNTPGGDSNLSQTVTIPPTGTTTLTFWYRPSTADDTCSTSCTYDWQEAQIRDTSGATLASIFKSNSNSGTWTKVTVDTSQYAGRNVVLWFNVHQDVASPPDDTWMYVDDVTLTQPGAPSAPTGVTATAGNGSATVSWTAPSDNGGSTITKYTVTPYIGSTAQSPTTVVTGSPPATTTPVTGLSNGTAYTFTVTATNATLTSPPSSPSNSVTPNNLPGAPTAVTATAGNGSATVSWTAPSNNGGSAITGYTVTPYIGSTAQTPVTVTGSPPATSKTVTGLTNGTAYTFTVSATNANGTGPASTPSNAVTPSGPTLPGAPTGVTATAGNASGTVSWTAPSDNGGSTINTYTVTPYIGSTAQTPVTVTGNPAATTTPVPLTNGNTYTFTVSATNATGTGPASSPSNSVTPSAPPAVTTVTPASGSTGNPVSVAPTATFSQAVVPNTVSFTVQDSTGNPAAGTVSFNSGNTVATFTPTNSLAASGTYTATVSGAQNSNNTPMSGPYTWSFTIAGQQCPCSIWQNATPSGAVDAADTSAVNLGVRFQASSSGYISGVRFYKYSDNAGSHTGSLWSSTGTLLASGTFSGESASGWQELAFSTPVQVTAGTTYVASYHTDTGHYAATSNGLASAVTNGPLTALASGGVYAYGSGNVFPSSTFNASNYWVDVVYSQSAGATPPVVTAVTPAAGSTNSPVSVAPAATFSQAVVPTTVSFTLKDSGGSTVPGSVSFNAGNTVATFTPTNSLAGSSTYTATVSGAQNGSGTPMSSPFSWSFTTGTVSQCPCSIWQNAAPSGAVDSPDSAVNLGVQFQATSAGYVAGVRFYKYVDNTGTHIGSLWTSSGTLLATGTFSNESDSGWQELDFSSPVAITANTTYVVSYHTDVGNYAATNSGLASAVTNGPLTALAGGGVYAYGSANAFPSSSFNSSNYWVDVVYSQTAGNTPPTVTTVTPASGSTGNPVSVAPTATFSQAVVPGTVSFTVKDSSNNTVPGSVSFNTGNTVATFTPTNSLAGSSTYTATVSGAQNTSGTPMSSPFTWSFTTTAVSQCPCSIWQNAAPPGAIDADEATGVNLGVQFRASSAGNVIGVRFYKYVDNTGSHIGSLWTSTGTLLASGTFSNESASGWQELDFSSPVAITANTTYVVSYHTDTGHYAATKQGLNSAVTNGPLTALARGGVYAYGSANAFPSSSFQSTNYWVDVVYSP